MMAIPPSRFVEHFLRLNGFDAKEFAGWELLPGMGFGEREAWWRGPGDRRDAPHEGVDLRGFRSRDGRSVLLGPRTRITVLWPGTVVAVVPDFLGRSVFVGHDRRDGEGRRLHSVYGHLEPRAGLALGSHLGWGDEVGLIADPAARKSSVPAHVHLTLAWIAAAGPRLPDWNVLREPARTVLVDPLPLICGIMPNRRSLL